MKNQRILSQLAKSNFRTGQIDEDSKRSIKLFFESGTDILEARQMVQERLIEVYALPAVSKPPVMLQHPRASALRLT